MKCEKCEAYQIGVALLQKQANEILEKVIKFQERIKKAEQELDKYKRALDIAVCYINHPKKYKEKIMNFSESEREFHLKKIDQILSQIPKTTKE